MSLPRTLLDTDILSAVMRRDPAAIDKARAYLSEHAVLTFSVITRYEVTRGLRAKDAHKRLASFNELCGRSAILAITDEVIDKAAEVYADLYKRGELTGDADILIAATAMVHCCTVATNNTSHFGRITGLSVTNWLG